MMLVKRKKGFHVLLKFRCGMLNEVLSVSLPALEYLGSRRWIRKCGLAGANMSQREGFEVSKE